MKIAILHDLVPADAAPDAADILTQVAAVRSALLADGHNVWEIPVTLNLTALADTLTRDRPDLVFNLVESLAGSGRLVYLVPALLDHLALPYTGAPTAALFTTSNKLLTKQWLVAQNIPTPAWYAPGNGEPAACPAERYIIKAVWEDASVGLDEDSVVYANSAADLERAGRERQSACGGEWFAERYVDGREFNLSLLGTAGGVTVLPPAEIVFDSYDSTRHKVLGYRAKWLPDSFEYRHTNRHFDFTAADQPLLAVLRTHAERCWQKFGLRGYARVDFRVADDGTAFVLEINANPCLAPDAGFAAACREAGLDYQTTIIRIIHDAVSV